MKNGTSLLRPSIWRKRLPLSTANRCSSCLVRSAVCISRTPLLVGKKRTSLGVRARRARQRRGSDSTAGMMWPLLGQQARLDQHLEHVRPELLQRRVLDRRPALRATAPCSGRSCRSPRSRSVEARRRNRSRSDLLGELSDEVVAAAGGRPHEVAALGRRRVDQELDLVVSEHREPLDRLADQPDARAMGPRLEEVVLHRSVADLLPVALARGRRVRATRLPARGGRPW